MLLRHARSRVRLRLPPSQPEAGVHLLPGQRALLQTSTPQDGGVPRDPAGLPGVRQEAGVRGKRLIVLRTTKTTMFFKRLCSWGKMSAFQVYNGTHLGLSSQ